METWTWAYDVADGIPEAGDGLPGGRFPTQGEAEAWLGEHWAELAERGVSAVSLRCGSELVYGPMSLGKEH